MSLPALRAAIVGQLQADLAGAAKVFAHGGRFNLPDLQRYALQGPAVLVGCLGVLKVLQAPGGIEATCVWGAFLVCGDKPPAHRDAVALGLLSALLPLVPGHLWGHDDVNGPLQIRADNLYSSELDKEGVALWAVTWQQEITLGQIDAAALDDFLAAHIQYDLAPADGTIDAADDLALAQ